MLSADNNFCPPATDSRPSIDPRSDEFRSRDEVVLGRSPVEAMACGLDGETAPGRPEGGIHRMITIEIYGLRASYDLLHQI